jgi:DNA-3-methyladenine glycosylase
VPGSFRVLPRTFFRRPSDEVARDLLGRCLVRELQGESLSLRLVEVEAYLGPADPACHTFGGRRTERVRSMYLGGGHAYVYAIYGKHCCLNVVTGAAGSGAAVLVRAGEAISGGERMAGLRGLDRKPRAGELAGGPGRLCQALGIDLRLDGVSLLAGELRLVAGEPVAAAEVVRGPRVGVGYAGDAASWPLRFWLRRSSEVSRPRPR